MLELQVLQVMMEYQVEEEILEHLEMMELQEMMVVVEHLEMMVMMEHLAHLELQVVAVNQEHLAHLVNLALLVVTGVNQILVVVLLVVLWQDLNIPSSPMEVTLE